MIVAVIWSVTCAPVMAQGEREGLLKDTKMQNVPKSSEWKWKFNWIWNRAENFGFSILDILFLK